MWEESAGVCRAPVGTRRSVHKNNTYLRSRTDLQFSEPPTWYVHSACGIRYSAVYITSSRQPYKRWPRRSLQLGNTWMKTSHESERGCMKDLNLLNSALACPEDVLEIPATSQMPQWDLWPYRCSNSAPWDSSWWSAPALPNCMTTTVWSLEFKTLQWWNTPVLEVISGPHLGARSSAVKKKGLRLKVRKRLRIILSELRWSSQLSVRPKQFSCYPPPHGNETNQNPGSLIFYSQHEKLTLHLALGTINRLTDASQSTL